MKREQVKMFISVAKHKSFTKAAEDFYTTQPTVSRQISALECEWGLKLFYRNKNDVHLTVEGEYMLKKCIEMDSILINAVEHAKGLSKLKVGKVSIGILGNVDVSHILLDTIDELEREYPNIKVIIETRSFSELRERLHYGDLDIIITMDFEVPSISKISYEIVALLETVFLISNRHSLIEKSELKIEDFDNQVFVIPCSAASPGRSKALVRICNGLGIRCKEIIPVSNLETVLFYVKAGRGVGVLDSSIKSIHNGEFKYLVLPQDICPLSMVRIWKRDNENSVLPIVLNAFEKHSKIPWIRV